MNTQPVIVHTHAEHHLPKLTAFNGREEIKENYARAADFILRAAHLTNFQQIIPWGKSFDIFEWDSIRIEDLLGLQQHVGLPAWYTALLQYWVALAPPQLGPVAPATTILHTPVGADLTPTLFAWIHDVLEAGYRQPGREHALAHITPEISHIIKATGLICMQVAQGKLLDEPVWKQILFQLLVVWDGVPDDSPQAILLSGVESALKIGKGLFHEDAAETAAREVVFFSDSLASTLDAEDLRGNPWDEAAEHLLFLHRRLEWVKHWQNRDMVVVSEFDPGVQRFLSNLR